MREGILIPDVQRHLWRPCRRLLRGGVIGVDGVLSDMQIFGKLGGTLTYFAHKYLWENSMRFLTSRELRAYAIKEKHKEKTEDRA